MAILACHLQVSPEKQDEAFKQLAASIVGSEAEALLCRYLQSTCLGGSCKCTFEVPAGTAWLPFC